MFEDSGGQPASRFRTIVKLSWIAVGVVALLVAGIFWIRWQTNRDINARVKEKAAAEARDQARRAFDLTGGNKFEILNFYAAPGIIHRGDSIDLCYGVSNAASVQLEPKTKDGVWPSLNRCLQAFPEKTTTYTLTAKDAAGHSKTASLTVTVLPH